MTLRIVVRGGGDLASGAILRMWRAGWQVLVTELAQPVTVRRYVSFAQAIYDGEMQIEDAHAVRVHDIAEIEQAWAAGSVPVIADPDLASQEQICAQVLVDGRMRKRPPETDCSAAQLVIGLGPGFTAGMDCHAVIETNRGPFLGRVIWQGMAQADTGTPEQVEGVRETRVLRAPMDGVLVDTAQIGALVQAGQTLARVGAEQIVAPFAGVLRGIMQSGLPVHGGEKVGDLDPRGDVRLCWLVSDKALAVGGGVLEAILSWKPLRAFSSPMGSSSRDEPSSRSERG